MARAVPGGLAFPRVQRKMIVHMVAGPESWFHDLRNLIRRARARIRSPPSHTASDECRCSGVGGKPWNRNQHDGGCEDMECKAHLPPYRQPLTRRPLDCVLPRASREGSAVGRLRGRTGKRLMKGRPPRGGHGRVVESWSQGSG